MSDTSYPSSVRAYMRIMNALQDIYAFLVRMFVSALALGLGVLAFYVVHVQCYQTAVPGSDSEWSLMYLLFGILSIIGGVTSWALASEAYDDEWMTWAVTNVIFGVCMWLLLGFVFLLTGFQSIPVSSGQFMVSSGHLYPAGTRAPRGYLKVRSLPFPDSISTTIRITKVDVLDNGKTSIVRNIDVALSTAPKPGPALDARLQKVAETEMFWGGSPEHYFDGAVANIRHSATLPVAGQTFPAPTPWLNQVQVVSVSQTVDLADSNAK